MPDLEIMAMLDRHRAEMRNQLAQLYETYEDVPNMLRKILRRGMKNKDEIRDAPDSAIMFFCGLAITGLLQAEIDLEELDAMADQEPL